MDLKKGWPLLALALPGGIAVVGGVSVAYCYTKLATGTQFDALRLPVIYGVARAFPTAPSLEKMRVMMLIAQNENSIGQVGDRTITKGPSIGPWQVLRQTAIDLGLYTPDPDASTSDDQAAYAALEESMSDFSLAYWGAEVFASKLQAAGGDINAAIALYNGSGPAAQQYLQTLLALANTNGWQEFQNHKKDHGLKPTQN